MSKQPQHQLLSLRPCFKESTGKWDKTDKTHADKRWGFQNIKELFTRTEEIVSQIPKNERFNFYYTAPRCAKKREFVQQEALFFDIDHIEITEDSSAWGGFQECKKYVDLTCKALQIPSDTPGVICSGRGLHFIVLLDTPFTDPIYFDKNKRHYDALCKGIELNLKREKLPGNLDYGIFEARRLMRLPGTINQKQERGPDKLCYIVQAPGAPVAYNLPEKSRLPEVEASDHIHPKNLKKFGPYDKDAILEGCAFFKYMQTEPTKVTEREWYMGLSTLARVDRKLAHDISALDKKRYDYENTEAKIDQALDASGPMTCQGVQKIWGKCQTCPNFEKVHAAINLKSEGFISTAETGFHTISYDSKGRMSRKPCYKDLRQWFYNEAPYKVIGSSGICVKWNGEFWKEWTIVELQSYAQDHFDPYADSKMTSEFQKLVCRTELTDPKWFTESIEKRLNFENGVLDLETGKLGPHSPEYGFQYVLPYKYDPTAKAPTFEKFLHDVMGGRKELIEILLEYVGYAFSGDRCWAQKCLILSGEGANGKSTLMNVLRALAGGETTCSSINLSELRDPVYRYSLVGKLFNLAEETPSAALMETAIFKKAVDGGFMSVKQLYKQPFDALIYTKHICAWNQTPDTTDVTKGFFRRLLIVPFDKCFEGAADDKNIGLRMLQELPGIFNLVYAAYQRLMENYKFTMSDYIEAEKEQYKLEVDNVHRWKEERLHLITLNGNNTKLPATKISDLYSNYRIYAESQGEKAALILPRPKFEKRLGRIVPDWKERKFQGTTRADREVRYRGVQLLGEDEKY